MAYQKIVTALHTINEDSIVLGIVSMFYVWITVLVKINIFIYIKSTDFTALRR